MKVRGFVAAVLGAVALLVGSAGTASADVGFTPGGYTGYDLWTFGDHGYCRGPIHVWLQQNRAKPGNVTAILTPGAFVGNAPDWNANPVCRVNVTFQYYNANVPFTQWRTVTVEAGPAPRPPTQLDLDMGYGLNLVSVWTQYVNYPVGLYTVNVP